METGAKCVRGKIAKWSFKNWKKLRIGPSEFLENF